MVFQTILSLGVVSTIGYIAYALGFSLYTSAWDLCTNKSFSTCVNSPLVDVLQTPTSSACFPIISFVSTLISFAVLVGIVIYLFPHFVVLNLLGAQNLKKKYGGSWACVTGGSSGIGRSLAQRLAKQGFNIILVALEDELLRKTQKELSAEFPSQEFRAVGLDLTQGNYDQVLDEKTKDIRDCTVVFCNAGYIVLGGFARTPLNRLVGNIECNVMSGVKISHLFMKRMMENKQKGLVCFTSSAAALFPAPAQSTYGSGKAFISAFANSIAIEAHQYGIDVTVMHPSPVLTNFYNKNVSGAVPKLDSFKFFLSIAHTADQVADIVMRGAGRLPSLDIGLFTLATRVFMSKFVEGNSMVAVMKRGVKLSGDYEKMKL